MVEPKWGIFVQIHAKEVQQKVKKKAFTAIFVCLITLLAGCNLKEDDAVTGIKFNRGHGSMWGNQFYIELQAAEIVLAHYIPEGEMDLVTVDSLPLSDTQWETIKSAVEQLPLEKARPKLFEMQKLDGGEFRELTLIRGEKETTYLWPNTPEAQKLEQLLEALLTPDRTR